jgi:hypothetical protein
MYQSEQKVAVLSNGLGMAALISCLDYLVRRHSRRRREKEIGIRKSWAQREQYHQVGVVIF